MWWRVKTGIRKATTDDIPALAETLSLAFEKDPVMDWVIRDDDKRQAAFRRYFTYFLKEGIPYNETYTTDAAEACAINWCPQRDSNPCCQLERLES